MRGLVKIFLISILFLFVAINVFVSLSQKSNSQKLVEANSKSTERPKRPSILNSAYGQEIDSQKQGDADIQQQKIDKVLELLEKAPDSRDLLLSLGILYSEQGNVEKASDYFEAAKKIDPWVKIPSL